MEKRYLAIMMIVGLMFSMITFSPLTVHSEEYFDGVINIVDGTGSGTGWSYGAGEVWINGNGSYLISGGGIETANRIRVQTGVTASVTLDNVVIAVALPFEVGGTANVTLILKDDSSNSLTSGGAHAGIRVQPSATLTITTAGQPSGNGILYAKGGDDTLSYWASAGIGGSELEQSGTIIIDGGTITAQGGFGRGSTTGGAGIGGSAHRGCGDITINGGDILAIGGIVGIGGGNSDPASFSGTITINGGTVKALPGLVAGVGPGIGFCTTLAINDSAHVEAYSSGVYPAIHGITPADGHTAYFLSMMLDSPVSANTELEIVNIDDEMDTLTIELPDNYRNFAVSVAGANSYRVAKADGSAYLALLADSSDVFIGEMTAPETLFAGLEASFIDYPVCRIDAAEYTSLAAAFSAAEDGDTITLLKDIEHAEKVTITGRELTIDLNGYILNINNPSGTALEVGAGGILNLAGEGELNVVGNEYTGHGVYAHDGGETSVTNATATGYSAIAAYAKDGGIVHVFGDAAGTATGLGSNTYCRGAQADGVHSTVYVEGDVTSLNNAGAVGQITGTLMIGGDVSGFFYGAYVDSGVIHLDGNATGRDYGVCAMSGGNVTVGGNATATGVGGSGAYAVNGGTTITVVGDAVSLADYGNGAVSASGASVYIQGDVISGGTDGYGIFSADVNAPIEVDGDVIAENGTGVRTLHEGIATVNGKIVALYYIQMEDQIYEFDDHLEVTTKEGYLTYSDGKSVVWVSAVPPADRIAGSNRYSTAIGVSQSGWETSDVVLLARGDNFADALAGVPLAHLLKAPILLSSTSQIGTATLDEIDRLGASTVIILGGESAISDDVKLVLEGEGLTVERIAGSNRYHTAVLIAEYMQNEGASFSTAFIAVGTNFPDALAAASYAAIRGEPILLTGTNTLAGVTKTAIESFNIQDTFIIGGTSVVSEAVAGELALYGTAERISGTNRYSTAVEIANRFDLDADHYFIATGLNFPDAITGAVLAAKQKTGVLLVNGTLDVPNTVVQDFVTLNSIQSVTLFGGTTVISEGIQNWFMDNL